MKSCALLLFSCVSVTCGWKLFEIAPITNPDLRTQGFHCLAQNFDIGLMKKGETKSIPGACGSATCNERSSVTYRGCTLVGEVYDGCELIRGQPEKSYPDCCDRLEC